MLFKNRQIPLDFARHLPINSPMIHSWPSSGESTLVLLDTLASAQEERERSREGRARLRQAIHGLKEVLRESQRRIDECRESLEADKAPGKMRDVFGLQPAVLVPSFPGEESLAPAQRVREEFIVRCASGRHRFLVRIFTNGDCSFPYLCNYCQTPLQPEVKNALEGLGRAKARPPETEAGSWHRV